VSTTDEQQQQQQQQQQANEQQQRSAEQQKVGVTTAERILLTQPSKRISRLKRRWLFLGSCLFVLVLVIVFFSSSLSRVQTVDVSGDNLIEFTDIRKAAKVMIDDQFLFVNAEEIRANIQKIKAFKKVTVTKDFPGVIRIKVTEHPIVAYFMTKDEQKEVVLASGKRLPLENEEWLDLPILKKWTGPKSEELLAKMATSLNQVNKVYLTDLSEIHLASSNTYSEKIRIFTNSGYEIFTTIEQFPKKMIYLRKMIQGLQSDNLDEGYLKMLDSTYYQPFIEEKKNETTQTEN
jgi:cell division protein FtsQ